MNPPFAHTDLQTSTLLELEEVALTVIHELSQTGLAHFEEAHRTAGLKNDCSVVTRGERAIEEQARSLLSRLTPEFGFVGEELGSIKVLGRAPLDLSRSREPKMVIQDHEGLLQFEKDLNTVEDDPLNPDVDTYWLLDSIDGTQNYISHVPTWSTLLALIHQGRPVLGVVAIPCIDQVFVASQGNGSHYGRLSESRTSFRPCIVRSHTTFDDAIIATGRSKAFQHRGIESWLLSLLARPAQTAELSDAFGYTRLLTGHIDAMIDPLAAAHDLAAIQVLFFETPGAYFCSLHGQNNHNTFKKGGAIAACSAELGTTILKNFWQLKSSEAIFGTLRSPQPSLGFFERFAPKEDRLFGQHREFREWAQAMEMAVSRFKLANPNILVEDLSIIGELREQFSQRIRNGESDGPPAHVRREGAQIRAIVAGGSALVTTALPEQSPKVELISHALNMALHHSREKNLPGDTEILAHRPLTCGHFGNLAWGALPNPSDFATTAKNIGAAQKESEQNDIRLFQSLIAQNVQHRFQIFLDGSQQTVSTGATLLRASATSARDEEKRIASRVRFTSGIASPEIVSPLHTSLLAQAAEESIALLDAPYVPEDLDYDYLAIDADLLGLILHEALGHALEGDLIELGQSGLGKDGQLLPVSVAPDWINVVIDARLTNCGFSPVDYEGTLAQRKTIVRNGKLVEAIHTRETALRMGHVAEGSARAQSVFFPSLNRMTSIWIQSEHLLPLPLPEGASLSESASPKILRDVLTEQGFLTNNRRIAYLAGWTGGTASGSNLEFRADVRTVHLLECAKEPQLMRQANFTGIATACFQSAVAAFGPVLCRTFGTCGKDGQGVPTSDGGPMILLLAKHPQVRVIGSGEAGETE